MIGVAIGEDCPIIDTPLNQLTGLFPDLQAIVVGLRRKIRSMCRILTTPFRSVTKPFW